MSADVAIFETHVLDPLVARDPAARCSGCGRRGTWAARRDRRDGATEQLTRYCRRCWPRAHTQTLEDSRGRRDQELRQLHEAARAARRSDDARIVITPELSQETVLAWHWSLAPGTLWRLWRARRSWL